MSDMNYDCAVEEMKKGGICARRGWNGKDMWVGHTPGVKSLPASSFWHPSARAFAETNRGCADVLPYFIKKTADGKILLGWIASQTDRVAEDWYIV
jgi:hypothetical protein